MIIFQREQSFDLRRLRILVLRGRRLVLGAIDALRLHLGRNVGARQLTSEVDVVSLPLCLGGEESTTFRHVLLECLDSVCLKVFRHLAQR